MNKLQKLQQEFRDKMKRLEQIRDIELGKLTRADRTERDKLLNEIDVITKDIDAAKRHADIDERNNPSDDDDAFSGLFDADGNLDDGISNQRQATHAYEIRSARDKKDFRSLWGENPLNQYRWDNEEQGCGFFEAVFSGRHHPGLTTRAMIEGISSEGGFLVPTEYAEEIHNVSLENEIVMPHALVIPMKSNDKKIPAMDIGDHSSNLYGGFTASYSPEAGTLSQNNPKARAMLLSCKKLYGFLRFSNELFEDIPGTGRQITEICGKGLAWFRDKFFLKGNGAGQPLGILNSNCLVEVAKETGQAASTITYQNLVDMMSRMFAASFKNSAWVCHQTCIPQLLTLSIPIGTGGSHIPVMTKSKDGRFEILTRPVIFTEKTESLGSQGDVMLCDFSQYVIGLREEMRIDFSPHLYFSSDQMAARLIERHDGQALWDEALTLEDGSTTVSPFVTLAERV